MIERDGGQVTEELRLGFLEQGEPAVGLGGGAGGGDQLIEGGQLSQFGVFPAHSEPTAG